MKTPDIWLSLALTPFLFALIQQQLNSTLACFNTCSNEVHCSFLKHDFSRNLRAKFSLFSRGHDQAQHFTQVCQCAFELVLHQVVCHTYVCACEQTVPSSR